MNDEYLEQRLEALKLLYLNSEVRVLVLRDHPRINIPGLETELKRGSEITLPRWVAKYLEEQGIVEIKEQKLTLKDIGRIAFLETRYISKPPSEMLSLPDNFYQKLREYLSNLKAKISEKPTIESVNEHTRLLSYIYDILRSRIQKILILAQLGEDVKDVLNKLAPEELILYKSIRTTIEKWQKIVLGIEETII